MTTSNVVLPRLAALLKPFVEAVAGPLPPIVFRPVTATAWQREMFVHADKHRRWCVYYDPASIDALLRRKRFGELAHMLAHELVHLINAEAKRLHLKRDWDSIKIDLPTCAADVDRNSSWNHYSHWSEGTAEMAAMAVSLGLISRGLADRLFIQAFGAAGASTLQPYVAGIMSALVLALNRSGYTTELDVNALNLPFDVRRFRRRVDTYLSEDAPYPQPQHMAFMPYALGVSRCGRLMKTQGWSLQELLARPLTDQQLRRVTGVRD